MTKKNWKQSLLKSGLPLEFEVKKQFIENNCIVSDEFTYIREDEENKLKEFSYDLDAYFQIERNAFKFLIECKYRSPGIKWLFLPAPTTYLKEIHKNSFLNTVDFFIRDESPYRYEEYSKLFPFTLGPICKKGIEIADEKYDESSIRKAINQLAYAIIEKIIESIDSQIGDVGEVAYKFIYHHIPIIVTTANLYLINENATIQEISNANEVEEIAKETDFLIYHHDIGRDLEEYNYEALKSYFEDKNKQYIKKSLHTFTDNLDHLIDVISTNHSPSCILIIRHDSESYQKLFFYLKELINPSKDTLLKIEKGAEEFRKKFEDMKNKFNSK
ncbi:hypothetical protein [Leptospira bouyouniensis]|uniref:hypothetical protein n=1 Tax=Leptospira bouyouniensis TaxID=2484911 RepID=UPI001AEFB2D4|nr:hypothetical protein [Leptospira bouyouniensis]